MSKSTLDLADEPEWVKTVATQAAHLSARAEETSWGYCYPPAAVPLADVDIDSLFGPDVVAEYLESPDEVADQYSDRPVDRHFVQPRGDWGTTAQVHTLLSRLDVSPGSHLTVIGAYTGEVAEAIAEYGVNVLFTDPIEGWCERAPDEFETACVAAEGLSRQTLQKTDGVISFECFQPLQGAGAVYNMLRTAPLEYGHILLESEWTRDDMDSHVTLLTDYSWLDDLTDGLARYRQSGGLRAYQFAASEITARELSQAGLAYWASIVVLLVKKLSTEDSTRREKAIADDAVIQGAAEMLNTDQESVIEALNRFNAFHYKHQLEGSPAERFYPPERFTQLDGLLGTLSSPFIEDPRP